MLWLSRSRDAVIWVLHLRIQAGILARCSVTVRIDLLLVHQFHLLVALGSHLVDSVSTSSTHEISGPSVAVLLLPLGLALLLL
jgi:hypothetical protein